MIENQKTSNWWNSLETHDEPYPHILEEDILKIIPQNLKRNWNDYMYGKTYLQTGDGKAGIYPWDLLGFTYRFCDNE